MQLESYLKQLFILMTVQVYFHKTVFRISPKVSYTINSLHKEVVFQTQNGRAGLQDCGVCFFQVVVAFLTLQLSLGEKS